MSSSIARPRELERAAPLGVLQLVPTLVVGGAERMVAALAGHLHRRGHRVGVAVMYDRLGTWIEAELDAAGVPVWFLGKRPGLDLRMVPRIARVLAEFRPDVLHTHMYVLKYGLPALAFTRRRCRVVHTLHSLARKEAELPTRLLQRIAFRMGVIPVAIGQSVAASALETYRLRSIEIVPNGVPVARCAALAGERELLRSALQIPEAAPVFVCVAQLLPPKNHEGLLAAFATPGLRALGARLLLAGDGPRRALLEERARTLGVLDRVHFLGVRSDVARLLAAADVFVLASHHEGNPISVMEAMAAGKPVVATAVGCIPELVDGSTGRLVPPEDAGALGAAMVELASDLGRARELGAGAAARARARFDDRAMVQAYERLYGR